MARILMVQPGPDFSVADVHRGWYKALKKQGHQIMVYNTNERLTFYGRALFENTEVPLCEHGRPQVRSALPDPEMVAQLATKGLLETCYSFWPDIVFFTSAFFHTAQTFHLLRTRGHKIVILHTESPYQDKEQMQRGVFANLNLLNDPTNMEQWLDLGPAAYVPHSYDDDVHYPEYPRKNEVDFSFVGTAFKTRCQFFSAMNFNGIDVAFGGNGWDKIDPEFHHLYQYLGHRPDECVDNAETARVYRISKAGINFYRREGEDSYKGAGWSMGPREVEMAACGLFFLRDPRPESDETFPMLPKFSSPAEAEELLRWYLKHDREREDAADMALTAVQDWTFEKRAAQVAKIMTKLEILK